MSSTRNKNQYADYNVKKRESLIFHNYITNPNYAIHNKTTLMELGSIPKFSGEQLSTNHVDIESMLRGIRSTNLEGPSFTVNPKPISLDHKAWFEKPKVVMPEDFVHSFTQRPNYLN
jgi:hypothetical protein